MRLKTTKNLVTVKPWGQYEVLAEGPYYLVKRLTIKPKHAISEQYHEHRAELWTIVAGEGLIKLNGESKITGSFGMQVTVARRQIHQIINTGETDLVLVEIQTGDIISESDIVRTNDPYGRK